MSHAEQRLFFELAVSNLKETLSPGVFEKFKVLEIGSHDVNGSVRNLFVGVGEYLGVDLAAGPGVDFVGFGHNVPDSFGPFDVVLSAETFEHDPDWRKTAKHMMALLKPGGFLIISCASLGRVEHGTSRSNPSQSPGTSAGVIDWYENVSWWTFRRVVQGLNLNDYQLIYNPFHCDLYFIGFSESGSQAATSDVAVSSFPRLSREQVSRVFSLTPLRKKLGRFPRVFLEHFNLLRALAAKRKLIPPVDVSDV